MKTGQCEEIFAHQPASVRADDLCMVNTPTLLSLGRALLIIAISLVSSACTSNHPKPPEPEFEVTTNEAKPAEILEKARKLRKQGADEEALRLIYGRLKSDKPIVDYRLKARLYYQMALIYRSKKKYDKAYAANYQALYGYTLDGRPSRLKLSVLFNNLCYASLMEDYSNIEYSWYQLHTYLGKAHRWTPINREEMLKLSKKYVRLLREDKDLNYIRSEYPEEYAENLKRFDDRRERLAYSLTTKGKFEAGEI